MYKIINRHVYEIDSGENVTLCDIIADTSSDLPDAVDIVLYKIAFGSFAFSIADKCFYCLDSSGTWTAADINASEFYTKSQIDTFLAAKQNALDSAQLDAVNSGIDSVKVSQIETNKNNITNIHDAIFFSEIIMGGDLNTITINECKIYNAPNNLPSGMVGGVLCTTRIIDNNMAIQDIVFITSPYSSYRRVKTSGTWNTWYQL